MTDEIRESDAGRLERAVRLFQFLARVQQIKQKPPLTFGAYERDGDVIWFHEHPDHGAIRGLAGQAEDDDPASPVLTIDRVPPLPPPVPPGDLQDWLTDVTDPEVAPVLRDALLPMDQPADRDGYEDVPVEHLADRPDVVALFDDWLPQWEGWAEVEQAASRVRDIYGRLFSMQVKALNQPEELEIVLVAACLGWQPDGHEAVRRHLFTAPALVEFDDTTGQLTVRPAESMEALSVELDMLDPALVRDAQRINDIRDAARTSAAGPLDEDEVSQLGRRLVHSLDPDGRYRVDLQPPRAGSEARVSYAPAVILRRRSQQSLIHAFEEIAAQLRTLGTVPEGLRPLVDPNHVPDPGLAWDGSDGAMVEVDKEVFLPLPVNERQLQIINRVDNTAQTLVQGPPGTGKTHTAAALISHLLAQGKRVLVTAQTDRALKEVRGKLPAAIQPLSVAVVGAGREDMADLKVAVERIASGSSEHDDERSRREIEEHLAAVDSLQQEQSAVHRQLVEAREVEVRSYERPEVSGTLAAIARYYEAGAADHAWLLGFETLGSDAAPPLTNGELARFRSLLVDEAILEDEAEALADLLDLDLGIYLSPEVLSVRIEGEQAARDADAGFADVHGHAAFGAFLRFEPAMRDQFKVELHRLANAAEALAKRDEAWMPGALADIQRGRASPWRARRKQIAQLLATAAPLIDELGPLRTVRCAPTTEPGTLVPLADSLRSHLSNGGRLKTDGAGAAKIGAMSPRAVKDAAPLFAAVTVDGLPPTALPSLDAFICWAKAGQMLDALDRAWPENTSIPHEETLSERFHWHEAELEQLDKVIALADDLAAQESQLTARGIQNLNWSDLNEVRLLGRVVDAVTHREALDAARRPIEEAAETLGGAARNRNAARCVRALHDAVVTRNADAYGEAWDRLRHLHEVRRLVSERDVLATTLAADAPTLCKALQADPYGDGWGSRVDRFEQAWRWASTGTWIREQEQADVNRLQRQLVVIEDKIRTHVERITAARAWRHALSEDRMTGESRANLEQYAQLVRRLGKGTGKYAAQRRSEIREAMARCRPSVPVWILPIYRIAEQLQISPNMFDVIVVDEASQAGLEATFLQYLAPKIVVIGDDKQVSPTAVGVDQQQLRDLASQYLYDDKYRASWQDPQRSLFDEAKMRYGGPIALVEHRRCVPEIIGFSNRVAYEPEGTRLIPVRQYGADRLDPIKTVLVEGGHAVGKQGHRINPVEIEAVVDRVLKCLADPAYDGLSFGVISLLGTAQAKQIEKELLDRVSPEEWSARDLRCGDSAAFQGSERDVMFLSMVAAPEPGKSLRPLTQLMHLQRYNVAASRAKDQMWLFHSVDLSDLGHPEDLRFQLLDYCYGRQKGATDTDLGLEGPVPDDIQIDPFESLFEQRVFNRLVERGYTVIPQYDVEGYRIDLVIVGSDTKVAIECDGDSWRGPDHYQAEQARRRDLQRCGWTFYNIRESHFYADRQSALEPLWGLLDDMDVRQLLPG